MAESVSPTRPAKPAGKLPQVPYPPHFTDFSFYNTGVSQVEYDALHGVFASLPIPGLKERNAAPEQFLPIPAASEATARLRSVPAADRPGLPTSFCGTCLAIPTFHRHNRLCVRFYAAKSSPAA